MSLLELFCAVDDFWKAFEPTWHQRQLTSGERQRQRRGELSESEMMTIVIHFHQARYRDFKTDYTQYVQVHLRREFPVLISYARFIQRLPALLYPLAPVLASRSSTRPRCPYVTITASTLIACLRELPPVAKPRWAGFSASSYTSSSMTGVNCSPYG